MFTFFLNCLHWSCLNAVSVPMFVLGGLRGSTAKSGSSCLLSFWSNNARRLLCTTSNLIKLGCKKAKAKIVFRNSPSFLVAFFCILHRDKIVPVSTALLTHHHQTLSHTHLVSCWSHRQMFCIHECWASLLFEPNKNVHWTGECSRELIYRQNLFTRRTENLFHMAKMMQLEAWKRICPALLQ